MIPDTRQRLEGALQDLTSYVVSYQSWQRFERQQSSTNTFASSSGAGDCNDGQGNSH